MPASCETVVEKYLIHCRDWQSDVHACIVKVISRTCVPSPRNDIVPCDGVKRLSLNFQLS